MVTWLPVTLNPIVCHLFIFSAELWNLVLLLSYVNKTFLSEKHIARYVLCKCEIDKTHSFLVVGTYFIIKNIENSSGKYWQDLNILLVGKIMFFVSGRNWRACTWLLTSYTTLAPSGSRPILGKASSIKFIGPASEMNKQKINDF